MPAVSHAQAVTARIALHHPEQLHAKNRRLALMNLDDLTHLARTPTKGLPKHTRKGTHG